MSTEAKARSVIFVAGSDLPSSIVTVSSARWQAGGYETTVLTPDWHNATTIVDVVEPVSRSIRSQLDLGRSVLVIGVGNGGLPAIAGTARFRERGVRVVTAGTVFDEFGTTVPQFHSESALRTHIRESERAGTLQISPDTVLNIVDSTVEGDVFDQVLPNTSVSPITLPSDGWEHPLTRALIDKQHLIAIFESEAAYSKSKIE